MPNPDVIQESLTRFDGAPAVAAKLADHLADLAKQVAKHRERYNRTEEGAVTDAEKPRPGLYRKFEVRRLTGRDKPGEEYFVLSPTHDPFSRDALMVYAERAREAGLHELADDIEMGLARVARGERFYPFVEPERDDSWGSSAFWAGVKRDEDEAGS